MGRARDNLNSTRSREDIDRDAEARRRVAEFRLHMLGAFDPKTYRAIVASLGETGLDPKVNIKTRTQAQLGYERAAGNLVREAPTFNIDNRAGIFTAQDFLREASETDASLGTAGGGVPPTMAPNDPAEALPTPSGDPRLPRAGVVPSDEPSDSLSSGALSAEATTPPDAALARPKPTGAVGSPVRPVPPDGNPTQTRQEPDRGQD